MKKFRELSNSTSTMMLATAVFFDALQAVVQPIMVIGQILSIFVAITAFLTFWIWFMLHGIKFTTAKRASTMGLGFLIELIPIINILPAWTLAVAITLADVKRKASKENSGEKSEV